LEIFLHHPPRRILLWRGVRRGILGQKPAEVYRAAASRFDRLSANGVG